MKGAIYLVLSTLCYELAYALKDEAAEGWLLCWEAAKAMRARAGGNHSRVWSKMLNPLVGWRERADQNIVKKDPKRFRLSCSCGYEICCVCGWDTGSGIF